MGYADKFDSMDSGRGQLPDGATLVFQVVDTFARDREGNIRIAQFGDSAGIPEVSLLVAPLRDPSNAKSIDRDLSTYHKVAVPFETPEARVLDQETYKKIINRLCNTVGDRLPQWDWKNKAAQRECFTEADNLAAELVSGDGDLNGCTFVAQVKLSKSEKTGKTYVNLTKVRQDLGDAQLTELA